MRFLVILYLVILYISVVNTLLNQFTRYAKSVGLKVSPKLITAGQIVAWTWPIYIPLGFICQIFYVPDVDKLKRDLEKSTNKDDIKDNTA